MQIKCRIFVNVSFRQHLVFLWIFSVAASVFGKNLIFSLKLIYFQSVDLFPISYEM